MKLSDAVMLGQGIVTFTPDDYLTEGCGCLLGGAFSAVTGKKSMRLWTELYAIWPWLERQFDIPKEIIPEFFTEVRDTGEEIVTHFAYAIGGGRATLEQAVNWIRSVEPVEAVSTQTEGRDPVCTETAEMVCRK